VAGIVPNEVQHLLWLFAGQPLVFSHCDAFP
jgi:hypothetical protein